MLNYLNKKIKRDGFTFIEVLLAISILSTGVAGAWIMLQKIIPFTSLSFSRQIAAYLVQEGFEIVRNIRDKSWLEGEVWGEGLQTGDREADYKSKNLQLAYQGRYLNIDSDGFYSYSDGAPTKFKRRINISISSDVINVLVEVQWEERGRTHSISGQEKLYNWLSQQ